LTASDVIWLIQRLNLFPNIPKIVEGFSEFTSEAIMPFNSTVKILNAKSCS